MDKDGDGSISKDEFKKVCKGLTNEQVTAAFNKFDKEGRGKYFSLSNQIFEGLLLKILENNHFVGNV